MSDSPAAALGLQYMQRTYTDISPRPIYRHAFATSKPRRRSSSGRFYLYFSLTATNPGETQNTLTVVRVLPAGQANLLVFDSTDADE